MTLFDVSMCSIFIGFVLWGASQSHSIILLRRRIEALEEFVEKLDIYPYR